MQIMDVIERPVAKQSMAINAKGASTMNKATDYAKALYVRTAFVWQRSCIKVMRALHKQN